MARWIRFWLTLALAVATSSIVCVILAVFLTDLIRRLMSRSFATVLGLHAGAGVVSGAALEAHHELAGDLLEARLRVVRDDLRLADRLQDLGVDLPHVGQELLLEVLDLVRRDLVEDPLV